MSVPAGGVTLQMDADDKQTGEAYVEFLTPEEAEKALYKDRQMIGHRYSVHTCRHILSKPYGWENVMLHCVL